jgi:hypothetical protein
MANKMRQYTSNVFAVKKINLAKIDFFDLLSQYGDIDYINWNNFSSNCHVYFSKKPSYKIFETNLNILVSTTHVSMVKT